MTARVTHLTSLDELRAVAEPWDDLWQRSDVASPTLRASLIALFVERFGGREPHASLPHSFRALVVDQDGRWVAGLPLMGDLMAGVLHVGAWPANQWSDSGDLLLDPGVDPQPVLDALAAAVDLLPWTVLRLADVPIDAVRWQQTLAAFGRVGVPCHFRPQMAPGRIDTREAWEPYRQTWPRRHRQQIARHMRSLAQRGRVELQVLDQLGPNEVEPWLSAGFDIEDRSWKGANGTSVRRTPGMFAFYLEQARELARYGELHLALLVLDGRPIAFAYGMCAKGVYRSYKVGYDPEFAQYSPGQLLRYRLLERFFHDDRYRAIEYITPSPAHIRWRPERYQVGRLLAGRRTWRGRCLLAAISMRPAKILRDGCCAEPANQSDRSDSSDSPDSPHSPLPGSRTGRVT